MLGGGNFIFTNKILGGAYINFISENKANVDMVERGYVALALPMGNTVAPIDKIIRITKGDFEKKSFELLGYSYDHDMLFPFREIFLNAKEILFYNLETTNGAVKAENSYATAKAYGEIGNSYSIRIETNIDESSKYDVSLLIDGKIKEKFLKVTKESFETLKSDYVEFKNQTSPLTKTINEPLIGGKNGTTSNYNDRHVDFLNLLEKEYFNALICYSSVDTTKALYTAFTKRLRDDVGAKFQTLIYSYDKANHEGLINVGGVWTREKLSLFKDNDMKNGSHIFYLGGAIAGCNINESITNKKYDGELEKENLTSDNQRKLEEYIKKGVLAVHTVGDDVRILSDINTFTEYTKDKNKDFSKGQIIRLLDQVAIDISTLFNKKYLGKYPNDDMGRLSLWKDLVLYCENLQNVRAIEKFKETDIVVSQGQEKSQLIVELKITPTVAMEQMYLTVVVR